MSTTVRRGTPHGNEDECWVVADLWKAAEGLPAKYIDIASLAEVWDPNMWVYYWKDPTHAHVKPELPRVRTANTAYAIILHPDGWLMDGMHRVAKRLMAGETTVLAVRLPPEKLPPPWSW